MKILLIILIASAVAYSQTTANKNVIVYAEMFGNGIFSSLNFERIIPNNVSLRFGMGFASSNTASNSGTHHDIEFFPFVMANYFSEIHGNNYFEIGGGFLIASPDFMPSVSRKPTTNSIIPTTSIGYRYIPKDRGIFFSVAFDTFIGGGLFPWGGVGIGYKF